MAYVMLNLFALVKVKNLLWLCMTVYSEIYA